FVRLMGPITHPYALSLEVVRVAALWFLKNPTGPVAELLARDIGDDDRAKLRDMLRDILGSAPAAQSVFLDLCRDLHVGERTIHLIRVQLACMGIWPAFPRREAA